VRLALGGDLVPDAVNVAGGVIDPYVRPGISLVEKLGQIFSALARAGMASVMPRSAVLHAPPLVRR
jgi:D-3-phosphoglycerate dehydrogenase